MVGVGRGSRAGSAWGLRRRAAAPDRLTPPCGRWGVRNLCGWAARPAGAPKPSRLGPGRPLGSKRGPLPSHPARGWEMSSPRRGIQPPRTPQEGNRAPPDPIGEHQPPVRCHDAPHRCREPQWAPSGPREHIGLGRSGQDRFRRGSRRPGMTGQHPALVRTQRGPRGSGRFRAVGLQRVGVQLLRAGLRHPADGRPRCPPAQSGSFDTAGTEGTAG